MNDKEEGSKERVKTRKVKAGKSSAKKKGTFSLVCE